MVDPFVMARFLANTIRDRRDCWNWTGSENSNGYGRFVLNDRHILAHRLSYELFFGKIPNGLNVCHKCDNRKCVNPEHLWLGSQSENLTDASTKGRMKQPDTRAHRNGNTTLTWDKVRAIRAMHARGLRKFHIARLFNVSASTISNITNHQTWKDERCA